jgi:hypothetical protein
MPTPTPPVAFRYVKLSPGPSLLGVALSTGTAVSVGAAIAAVSGFSTVGLAIAAVAGAATGLVLGRRSGPLLARTGYTPTAMALVPWGVLIEPDENDGAARVLRWAALRRIHVRHVHSRDAHGTPITNGSVVTIETERTTFIGSSSGAISIENLEAHLDRYIEQSSRPVALDLSGATPLVTSPFEACAPALLRRMYRLIETVEGINELSLISDDFRGADTHQPTEATTATLADLLATPPTRGADARALAALVAGELGQRGCLARLLLLATDVHPMVALCARAAALKLGEEPSRGGALEELAHFVQAQDVECLMEWAHGSQTNTRDV